MAAPWCFALRPAIILNAGEFLLHHRRPYGTSSTSPASRLVARSSRQVRLPSTTAQPLPVHMASRPTPDLAENSSPAFPASAKWGFGASPPGSSRLRVVRATNPASLAPGSSRCCPPDLCLSRDPAEAAPSSVTALYRCVQLIQWRPSASFAPVSARVCARLGAPSSFCLPRQPRASIAMAAGLCFSRYQLAYWLFPRRHIRRSWVRVPDGPVSFILPNSHSTTWAKSSWAAAVCCNPTCACFFLVQRI
nr:uncharacterized protein LOC120968908 isoform X1 [Aegilops tauschii subsp. strangulata]